MSTDNHPTQTAKRLSRYWHAKKPVLLLSIPYCAMMVALGQWTDFLPVALVATLAWMDTP